MKKLLLAVFILLSVNVAFAQFEKKIKSSDEDVQNEKKKTNPKTWISRAELFQNIFDEPVKSLWERMSQMEVNLVLRDQKVIGNEVDKIGEEDYTILIYPDKKLYFDAEGLLRAWVVTKKEVEDPLQTAYDAYMEAIKLEKDKGVGNKKINAGMIRLSNQYKSKATNSFNLEDFNAALKNFKQSLACTSNPVVGITDSLVIYYTGVTANVLKDNKTAEEYFNKAIQIGYTLNGEAYQRLAMLYGEEGKKEQQLATLEAALKKFPENSQIMLSLIDYYRFAGDDPKKVLPLIEQVKATEPNNAALFYAEGTLYEKIADDTKSEDDYNKAIECYKKAIEIDPNYFFGYYGLGALYFNRAAIYNNEAVETPVNQVEKYEQLLKLAEEQFELSLEPMLKAYELNPNEKVIVQSLKDIYFRFRTKKTEYQVEYDKFNNILLEM
ncbi:MAG: tetratricopeptide repeat protein [Prevotellaceae bacterium]|jgi:tetratricopeptide (TPR) repeat protein|nr:tetratricopeptide repeat protein [Prevotellaceae bacterium]